MLVCASVQKEAEVTYKVELSGVDAGDGDGLMILTALNQFLAGRLKGFALYALIVSLYSKTFTKLPHKVL